MKIELPIYPITLYIYKGLTDKEFTKRLKRDSDGRVTNKFINGMCIPCEACVNNHGTNVVMRFSTKYPKNKIIAHEIVHVVRAITDTLGLKLTEDSEEAYAYLTGYIFSLVENTNEKSNSKNKKRIQGKKQKRKKPIKRKPKQKGGNQKAKTS